MRKHERALEQDRDRFLADIARRWPMAKGCLSEVRRPCVRPQCAACASGRKHPAFIFSFMDKGRRRCMYVPRELVAPLRQAIANGRWVQEELTRMGVRLIEQYRRERTKKSVPRESR